MTELPHELLNQDTPTLLENETFRTWAKRTDLPTPEGYPEVATARAILAGVTRDEEIALPTAEEKQADFAALMQRVEQESPATVARPAKVRRLLPVLAAAAAVLVLLTAATLFLWPKEPATTQYATTNGELRTVELPDGTTVTLNANSTLTLSAEDWENTDRSVHLTGEAFFDVTKQSGSNGARAFLVKTDDLTVRVLGTRFDVRERGDRSRVYLEEGKVKVLWQDDQSTVTDLTPGELVEKESPKNQPVVRRVSVPERVTSWKRGHLTFAAVSLREALSELEAIYGIQFVDVDPVLFQKEVSSAGIPVADKELALQLLESALGLQIDHKGGDLYTVTAE